jgi:hypothetical protein
MVYIEPHLFIRSLDRSGFGEEVEKTGVNTSDTNAVTENQPSEAALVR